MSFVLSSAPRESLTIKRSSEIFIYSLFGNGNVVNQRSVDKLVKNLAKIGVAGSHIVLFDSPKELQGERFKRARGLIIPGGGSLVMASFLSPVFGHIRSEVRSGLGFLGVCAGGMIAAETMHVSFPASEKILKSKEQGLARFHLDLLPVIAKGPAYSDRRKQAAVSVGKKSSLKVYWDKGCQFVPSNPLAAKSFTVVNRYKDLPGRPAAVVKGTYGKGKVVLTGIHPEVVGSSSESCDATKCLALFKSTCQAAGLIDE